MLAEEKEIVVIPTKTVPQGITAMINFIPEQSVEENKETSYDSPRNHGDLERLVTNDEHRHKGRNTSFCRTSA